MIGTIFTLLPALLLAALLLVAAVFDLRSRIIPNRLNIVIALTAPLAWWAGGLSPWPDIAIQIAAAAAVFLFFVGLFAMNSIGGGDVKLIGALALWIPVKLLLPLLLIMSLVGGLIAAVMIVRRRLSTAPQNGELPYGVAIAAAGLWALHEQYLNHLPITHII